jgi:hypothetical protein
MESLTADRVSKRAVTAPESVNNYKDGEVRGRTWGYRDRTFLTEIERSKVLGRTRESVKSYHWALTSDN